MDDTPQPEAPELLATETEEIPTKSVETAPVRRWAFVARFYRALGRIWIVLIVMAFAAGSFLGYRVGMQQVEKGTGASQSDQPHSTMSEVNPTEGYKMPARYGDLGPRLVAAGGIDYKKYLDVYEQAGRPLTDEQKLILTRGLDKEIVITPQNGYFLLNFFWAVGLTNRNAILDQGPMMSKGKENVGNFASTGGWTIGAADAVKLYSSASLITLTSDQQKLLEDVAKEVYRPCCNNPTHFPDCNHGMAMLGLLELLASQGASKEQMFEAAKYANAFWYPQQYLELATLFKATQNVDFAQADSAQAVSSRYASGSGFQAVHAWLANNNLLEQGTNQGNSCGVK